MTLEEELEGHIYDWEDYPFTDVTSEKIEDQSRWSTFYSKVVKDNRTDKLYEVLWDRGSTEYQESSGEITFYEVEPKQVTVTKYVKKQKETN